MAHNPQRRPKRLSIGVRWTLRYSAAVLVVLVLFSFYVYERVERRIYGQAKLLLNVQVNALLQEGRRFGLGSEEFAAYVGRRLEVVAPELEMSVQLLNEKAEPLRAWGTLAEHAVPLAQSLLLGERDWTYDEEELGGTFPYWVMASAVPEGGFIQAAINSQRFVESAEHIREVFLLALPLLLLLTGSVGYWLARGSLRPIAEMTKSARRIHGANLEERVPTTGAGDELDQLAETLNAMIARIQDSVASLRRFNANAAHQLRTPLTALKSQLEVTLEKERSPVEYRRVLEAFSEEVESMAEAVNAMLRLAQSEAGLDPQQRVLVDLSTLLSEVTAFFEPVAAEHGLALSCTGAADVTVPGDPAWLHQLFANLLHNAVKYTPEGGRIEVELRREAERARVCVRDTGVGIAESERERIFERFHRGSTHSDEPGAGLGLTIAGEIARAHGGSIEVEGAPGRGTTFAVELPLPSTES